MNAGKRQRPSIDLDDVQKLLFHLEHARNYVLKYSSAQGFYAREREVADNLTYSIDYLAGSIKGICEHLWQPNVSVRGNDRDTCLAKDVPYCGANSWGMAATEGVQI